MSNRKDSKKKNKWQEPDLLQNWDEPSVANVNKPKEKLDERNKREKRKIETPKKGKNKRQKTPSRELPSEEFDNQQETSRNEESAVENDLHADDFVSINPDEDAVDFIEDDHRTVMKVNADERDLQSDHSDDEEEGEIVLNKTPKSTNNNATKSGEKGELDLPNEKSTAARRSLCQEEREEVIGEMMSRIEGMINSSEIKEAASLIKKFFEFQQGNKGSAAQTLRHREEGENLCLESQSEVTIYKNAVLDQTNAPPSKRFSSSSEEGELDEDNMVTTQEGNIIPVPIEGSSEENNVAGISDLIAKFVVENRPSPVRQIEHRHKPKSKVTYDVEQPIPSISKDNRQGDKSEEYEDHADKMIREAEKAKAKIFQTPGNIALPHSNENLQQNFLLSTVVDQHYMFLVGHVDAQLKAKIESGEFVDLSKLLPKDRVMTQEDQRLQMVIRNGQTFWVPFSDAISITNFAKCEQAFRVYSDIYSRAHPTRASELLQYCHVINTISTQYIWDNVYMYDKDFHLHMARHPEQSWAIILQQAWSMRLRERLHFNHNNNTPGANKNHKSRLGEVCRRYNRGRCSYGTSCRYEHRCSFCNKFGHPLIHCRRAQNDRDRDKDKTLMNGQAKTVTPQNKSNN